MAITGATSIAGALNGRSCHGTAEHPTQKPLGILKIILEYSCVPAGTVLDLFMGSGSTLAAARETGRRAIGIEIEERYCEIAAKRLSQHVIDFSGNDANDLQPVQEGLLS